MDADTPDIPDHQATPETPDAAPVSDAVTPGPADGAPGAPGPLDAELVRALEAIILVATEPVPSDMLAQLLEQPTTVIDEVCRRLAEAYEEAGHGFVLVRVAGGWRYQSHPDVTAYVERFILDGQRARLSGAALETLAIVAYKQPISRAQVASIRGVDPDGVLRTLQGRGYIDQVGRDPGPGQAVLWGTTPLFLEKLGLDSVDQLPPLGEFVPGADVVEALEHGLRVTPAPVDLPAPAPVPVPELQAEQDTATEPDTAPEPGRADDGVTDG
jgi:segregation and condensation protein B